MITGTTAGLGPARVLEVAERLVLLERPGGAAWAQLALAHPYRPEPDDVVLAIGDEEVYVIGVLSGRGRTVFEVQGDLEIRASGRLSLSAKTIETTAEQSFERFEQRSLWVKDAIHTTAGRVRTVVEGESSTIAERIVETAEQEVKIDGRQILLG